MSKKQNKVEVVATVYLSQSSYEVLTKITKPKIVVEEFVVEEIERCMKIAKARIEHGMLNPRKNVDKIQANIDYLKECLADFESELALAQTKVVCDDVKERETKMREVGATPLAQRVKLETLTLTREQGLSPYWTLGRFGLRLGGRYEQDVKYRGRIVGRIVTQDSKGFEAVLGNRYISDRLSYKDSLLLLIATYQRGVKA